jgi:nucleoside 2-deoxyribosyltransferase
LPVTPLDPGGFFVAMRIFVSLKALRGDPELEKLADLTRVAIRQAGHEPFVASNEIINQGFTNPKDFMPFIRQQVTNCDLMIVLYHPELRGGLIEMGLAYARKMPIWLCYASGQKVSNSALGCVDLTIKYASFKEFQSNLAAQLRENFQSE